MLEENPKDWHMILLDTLWAYRTSKRSSTRVSPFSLTYGQDAVLPMEVVTPPFPDPIRMADPNRVWGARLSTGTLIDQFFLRADTCTCFLIHMHNFYNNKKNHLHTYKTTTGVVSLKIYTHILSPIYLDMYIFFLIQHIRDRGSSAVSTYF